MGLKDLAKDVAAYWERLVNGSRNHAPDLLEIRQNIRSRTKQIEIVNIKNEIH